MSIRVTSTADPRLTRTVRSYASASERARWLVLATGSAEIQRRDPDGVWRTVERRDRAEKGKAGR